MNPKRSFLQKILGKIVPGMNTLQKQEDNSNAKATEFNSMADAMKQLRTLKSQLPKPSSPAEYNSLMQKFNSQPSVMKLKDKIYQYKVKQSAGNPKSL